RAETKARRGVVNMSDPCPLYPRKRPWIKTAAMSARFVPKAEGIGLPIRRTQSDQLRSEGAVRLFEKHGFLWGRDSSKYAVAMRKAPKSVNNRPVSFGPSLQLRITEACRQCDRANLRLAIL